MHKKCTRIGIISRRKLKEIFGQGQGPWPRGSSRTPDEAFGLGLGTSGLGLGLERKVLALAS